MVNKTLEPPKIDEFELSKAAPKVKAYKPNVTFSCLA